MRILFSGRLLAFSAVCASLISFNAHAEQDMRELVKELTSQIKTLQKQVAQSNARIDELEHQLKRGNGDSSVAASFQAAEASGKPTENQVLASTASGSVEKNSKPIVTAGDVKGTIKLPGTDTSIGIGGFVKLDTLFNSTGMGQDTFGNQRLEVAEIPVGAVKPGNDDQIALHAKESRFWFKSFTPSQWGDINTYLEIDFYGDARIGTYTPRVRHAYGSLGNLLAGQTWSTFFNSQAIANTLDFSNSVGALFLLRQPQLRWTQPFSIGGSALDWQLAIEAPSTRVRDASQNQPGLVTVRSDHYPDLVARLNYYADWGNISLAAMGRHMQYTPATTQMAQSKWGGAVSLAGKINVFGRDNVRFMANYGDALGRYLANNFFEDGVVNGAGALETVVSYSGMVAYQHWWDDAWRSTVAYGYARADQPGFADKANLQSQSLHANLLWNPIMQTTIGLEYIYANRELVNGQNGELQRVQFSTRFNF